MITCPPPRGWSTVSTDDVRCSESELRLLRPLDEMSSRTRHAATRWLWQHDITPSTVAIGVPIERDTVQNLLVWREQRRDGTVLKRWRFAAHEGIDPWPAPFPASLRTEGARQPHQTESTCSS